MNRTWRCVLAVAIGFVSIGSTCSSEDDRVTGTYRLNIVESRDSCDLDLDGYSSEATISTGANGGYVITFGEEGELTGDFNDEGLLIAEGNTLVVVEGIPVAGILRIGIIIRQGQITDGSGRLTFEGTYPGVPGVCVQEFFITGRRDNVSPILG